MKAFIDLGAYTGDSLELALEKYRDFDAFFIFEPYHPNYEQIQKKFANHPNVHLYPQAADTENRTGKLFLHKQVVGRTSAAEGNSLLSEKGNVSKDIFESVTCIDFAEFLKKNVTKDDYVVLKIDIEGKEYDLLEHLIATDTIGLIDEIFCEWHYHKIPSLAPRHAPLLEKLQKLGFSLTGKNNADEWSRVVGSNLLLSVVIATFNRKDVLRGLLDTLKDQTDSHFEVVVAVDGSSDGTQEMLSEYQKTSPFPLRWVDTELKDTYGLARARNLGITESHGEAVVILDDDSFPVPEFVAEHKKTVHQKTLTGGARESNDPTDNLKEKNRLYLETFGDSTPHTFVPVPKYKWVVENNTCMFRHDWIESGMFDESITAYGLIGQTFNKQLIRLGYQYQFNPRAKIIHHTEFKQNHLYKRIKPQKIRRVLIDILQKFSPALLRVLKMIKQKIEYR